MPTEAEIKRQIDFLSRWKNNQYFFYSETSIEMQGYSLMSPKGRYTAEQVRSIVEYARKRHVDVVPCVELYGHLHDLFRIERYADLAVVPHGQDFNALDPRVMKVIGDWVDELVRLFPSPFIHIGFDEPYDLDKSSAMSKVTPGKLYVGQLTRVVNLVEQRGKHVMFWADTVNIFSKYPEVIPELPKGIIAVPWLDFITKDYTPWFAPWASHHIPAIESTYIHDCLSIFPEYNYSFDIIDGLLATGRKYGIVGQLINLWTDSNQDLYRMAWPGLAYGAAAAWQSTPVARRTVLRGLLSHRLPAASGRRSCAGLAGVDRLRGASRKGLRPGNTHPHMGRPALTRQHCVVSRPRGRPSRGPLAGRAGRGAPRPRACHRRRSQHA